MKGGIEVSVSSHYIEKNTVLKKNNEGKVIYTKEALLSNNSEMHLVEHQNDVPDLLPTQENNALFESKYTNSSKKPTNSAIKGSKNLFSLAGSPIIVREAGREPQQRQEGAITDEQIEQLNNQLGLRYNTEQSEILYRSTNETDQELTEHSKEWRPILDNHPNNTVCNLPNLFLTYTQYISKLPDTHFIDI